VKTRELLKKLEEIHDYTFSIMGELEDLANAVEVEEIEIALDALAGAMYVVDSQVFALICEVREYLKAGVEEA